MDARRFVLADQAGIPSAPMPQAGGFVALPAALMPCQPQTIAWMQSVYQRAYEQAQKALAPTWYDRVRVASAN